MRRLLRKASQILLPTPSKRRIKKEERTLLKEVIEHIPQSMLIFDKELRIVAVYNLNPITISEWKEEDIIGKSLDFFIHAPSSAYHQTCLLLDKHLKSVIQTGKPAHFESVINHYHIEATLSKLPQERVLAQIQDITTIVDHRNEIERQGRNETAVALTAGGLTSWSYDVDSQTLSSTHGNNVIGDLMPLAAMLSLSPPKDQEKVIAMFDKIINHQSTHEEITVQVINVEGNKQLSNVHAIPHLYSNDGNVKVIIGSQKDVTEEYERMQEVTTGRFKLKLALQTSGIMPWDCNLETQAINVLESPEKTGRQISLSDFSQMIHPEDRELYHTHLRDISEGLSDNDEFQLRVSIRDEYRWMLINASVFARDEHNKPLSLIGLGQDISENIKTTQEFIRLRDKAEESNRLKSAFLANMSHEIRTPLNAIVGFSNQLAYTDDKEEIKEYISIINLNNDMLLKLINDILDLSKIEAGKIEFNYSNFNVSELAVQLHASIAAKAQPGVEIRVETPEDPVMITSDILRVSQVVNNFLTNAIKFTTKGYICLGYHACQDGIYLYVKDTGIGISSEQAATVFGRFVKFNPYAQGSGLGLSICETIIHLLGGEIGVDSEPGQGSTFWCCIPNAKI